MKTSFFSFLFLCFLSSSFCSPNLLNLSVNSQTNHLMNEGSLSSLFIYDDGRGKPLASWYIYIYAPNLTICIGFKFIYTRYNTLCICVLAAIKAFWNWCDEHTCPLSPPIGALVVLFLFLLQRALPSH
jgi:hypothetical protein